MKESTRCLVVVAIAVIAAGCGDHATLAVMDVAPDEQSYLSAHRNSLLAAMKYI